MTVIPEIEQLVTDVHARLSATAAEGVPAAPGKKQMEAVDPSLRDDVMAAFEARREELGADKAVAAAEAKQAEGLAEQMSGDLERLLKVARRD
jgi:hypothetical protein